ncbi:phenylalanine--tRNA ligase subunit beta [Chitinophagales bacterium]|nr:phenylalanine--tRNA ligase subunit beta [Chitinophagales bacterium]
MNISYNWIKDYLQIDLPAQAVSELLTAIGLEVEGMQETGLQRENMKGLVVGHVLETEQHPNADRLRLTKIDIGSGEPLPIVCGAPNVAPGQKVIVATVGSVLHPLEGDSFKIKKGKIRGEISLGMLCAEDEIGLGKGHDGIMILPEDTTVGSEVFDAIESEGDVIFEIGLTPNRSDATGHIGVAKDLAAALQITQKLDVEVKEPTVDLAVGTGHPISVGVEDLAACPRYAGLCLSNVTVKESPEWLQQRLESIGVRAINNIVDITNFVLHEMGQPLHAFDLDEIRGNKIIVKKEAAGTKFLSLDEIERELNAEDLMICDAEGGMCIAGIFGGLKSGVTDKTTSIFLESACFEATGIRRSSHRHQLRTDAATRFEKGVDPNNTVNALKRAAQLMIELAGASVSSDLVDIYPSPVAKKEIKVRYAQVNRLAGTAIPSPLSYAILAALEMDPQQLDDETVLVKVPTNKVDVIREVDVVEEILRIYGFDNVPVSNSISASLAPAVLEGKQQSIESIANFLSSNGYREIMNNSLTSSKLQEGKYEGKEQVSLLNSLNVHLDVLRMDLLFGGLESIRHNQNRQAPNTSFFEFGTTYWQENEKYKEEQILCLLQSGIVGDNDWRNSSRSIQFFDLKENFEAVLAKLGAKVSRRTELKDDRFAYGLQYELGRAVLGVAGALSPTLLKEMDVQGEVFAGIIHWDTIMANNSGKSISFKELPKHPAVNRDLALLVSKATAFADIEKHAKKVGGSLLKEINLFDVYEDKKLGENLKSYAVNFLFQDDTRTLTRKEVDEKMDKMLKTFEKELGAQLKI